MPIKLTETTAVLRVSPSGGTVGVNTGVVGTAKAHTDASTSKIQSKPYQIAGLIPLTNCNESECRTYNGDCYVNPVFGNYGGIGAGKSTYGNDISNFVINDDQKKPIVYILQKLQLAEWKDICSISKSSLYAKFDNYGSVKFHPTYSQLTIDWGRMLYIFGTGKYRIKVQNDTSAICSVTTNIPAVKSIYVIELLSISAFGATYLFDNIKRISSKFSITNATGGTLPYTSIGVLSYYASLYVQYLNTYQATLSTPLWTAVYLSPSATYPKGAIILYGNNGQNIDGNNIFDGVHPSYQWIQKQIGVAAHPATKQIPCTYASFCMTSEVFDLKRFNCVVADKTVKFENTLSGKIGSITTAGKVFDLNGIKIYDSIRFNGFFGKEKPKYDEIILEYQTGLIERVRDEVLQNYTLESELIPKWLHDRFKTYALMSDTLLVSDYNMNNSDYNIKQRMVVKEGTYDAEYYKGNIQLSIKVGFKDGIQSIIKNIY